MRESLKNAMRSGLVVIGAVAFGYLTLQLGFKPYLQEQQQHMLSLQQQQQQELELEKQKLSADLVGQFDDSNILISDDEGFSHKSHDS